jgi:hypothetical protein
MSRIGAAERGRQWAREQAQQSGRQGALSKVEVASHEFNRRATRRLPKRKLGGPPPTSAEAHLDCDRLVFWRGIPKRAVEMSVAFMIDMAAMRRPL